MAKKNVILPTVVTLDEWVKEIDGYEFVFEIKKTSGGGKPTWYPIKFWKKGDPYYSVGGKFDDKPTREQVEEEFLPTVKNHIKFHLTK